MAIRYRLAALLVLLAGLLAGCGQAEPTAGPNSPSDTQGSSASTPSAIAATGESEDSVSGSSAQDDDPSEINGWYGVEGHQLYLHCLGTGRPTAIMEAGFNDTGETWYVVQAEVATATRACAYDRAGLGRSDPGPESPTSLQVVYQLHKMLGDAGIEGPYVLVGHSLGAVPLVVLTAPHKERADDLAAGLSDRFEEIWAEMQEEMAQMSANSTHVIAEESGHFVRHDQPELVINAILGLIEDCSR
jgi:pimeloyl-ACP methyl ester carboxylesterase